MAAADIMLSTQEITEIDAALARLKVSEERCTAQGDIRELASRFPPDHLPNNLAF